MSIALHSNGGGGRGGGEVIPRSRFVHGGGGGGGGGAMPCRSIYGDRRRLEERDSDSCSSSSIGRNSDLSGGSLDGGDSCDEEVQSSFKGPLDTMDALEEVLPIKRGMSKFYSGKSKSFTSLADAASVSSVKDFAKPENPYNRKRKNLLTRTNLLHKNRNCPLKNTGAGTSKRQANFNRGTFLLSETTNSSHNESSSASTSPSCSSLPPLHPHGKKLPPIGSLSPPQRQSPRRSFSLSDLQSFSASTPNITGLAISREDKQNQLH